MNNPFVSPDDVRAFGKRGELMDSARRRGISPDFDQLVRFLPVVEPVEDGSDIGR
jgi:hypothetical protein